MDSLLGNPPKPSRLAILKTRLHKRFFPDHYYLSWIREAELAKEREVNAAYERGGSDAAADAIVRGNWDIDEAAKEHRRHVSMKFFEEVRRRPGVVLPERWLGDDPACSSAEFNHY